MNAVMYTSINILFSIIDYILLIRVILSWIPIGRNNVFVNIIYNLTEPMLQPIRNLINKSPIGDALMIDFSIIILYILLRVIRSVILSLI